MHRIARALAIVALVAAGAAACSGSGTGADEDPASSDDAVAAAQQSPTTPIVLTDAQRGDLVEKKVTCPFVGATVWLKKLAVRNAFGNPLALVSDVAALGDTGGGDLGSVVLTVFALGNHHRMHGIMTGPNGGLAWTPGLVEEVPAGTFSLDFPPAQGSHPGHSGILEEGTKGSYHGALNADALRRLTDEAVDVDGRSKNDPAFRGPMYIRRSDVGAFVWKDVTADPEAVYFGHGLSLTLLHDLLALHQSPSVEKLVKLSGTDNLVGSSGEFGLLMTLLEVPGVQVGGQPVMRAEDVRALFADKKLPAGWDARPKKATRWVENTMGILTAAEGGRLHGLL